MDGHGKDLGQHVMPEGINALDETAVVQPVVVQYQVFRLDLEEIGQQDANGGRRITDADDVVKPSVADHRLRDDPRRIREVDEPGVGCNLVQLIEHAQHHGDGADGHGKAACADRFLPQNIHREGNAFVQRTHMVATHAYGGDNEGCSGHALAERSGVRDLDRAVSVLDDGFDDLVHDGEPLALGIDQLDLRETEPFLKVKESTHENRDSCST